MLDIVIEKEKNRAVAYIYNVQAGLCEYIYEQDTINIVHTEVNKEYQGKGIARKLVEAVIQKAEQQNKQIKADCSYAAKVIAENK